MGEAGTKGVPREDRRRQLLHGGIEAFGRQGYAQVSVAEVAATAGVSKAMVYHLFDSKEGLALACLEEVGAPLVSAVRDAQVATDPVPRALDTLAAIFGVLSEHRYGWAVVYDPSLPVGSAAAAAAEAYRDELGSLGTTGSGEIVRAAGSDDPLDHEFVDRLWQSAVATTMRFWQEHDELTADDVMERCARFLSVLAR
ncbi:hypothetical protein N802_18340 [Knoellia sinensis KCTC 19936]|uniref:HTH tetR-type domain-containing protein n=1 Tax=Knoellia sinensis KCTC 19936 TaxID=1385520 RepID=A0A0A0J6B2_9MICO|nr:TetR/AcrR family transcriptional regulator [Knoellia sinensis]KGN32324.1 hypothetical protein N802_18340 [Knoellia sinensis KCTC 19936]